MKRPLIIITLSQIAGIVTGYLFRSVVIVFIISLAFLFFCLIAFNKSKYAFAVLFYTLVFFIAGALGYLYTDTVNTTKYREFSGNTVQIKGIVVSEPGISNGSVKYVIKTSEIIFNGIEKTVKGKILLTVVPDSGSYIDYGREIIVRGKIKLPNEARNQGGFNYAMYLAQSGISATVYASFDSVEFLGYGNSNILVKAGRAVRNKIVEVIDKSLPFQQAQLLNGMLIGYAEKLDENVEEVFKDAGLTHIMAVSGANIGFIILLFTFIFKKIGLGKRLSSAVMICILIFFAFITGFSPSVVRAVIMGIICMAAGLFRREYDLPNSLALSALLMLLFNPFILFNIGFQLSYAATISILVLFKYIKSILYSIFVPEKLAEMIAVTLSAQIGVLPISVFYFNRISIISVVSNLLVAPVLEPITIIGVIMAFMGQFSVAISTIIGYVNCTLLSFVLYVSKISSQLPFAVLTVPTPPIAMILLYYMFVPVILIYIASRDWKKILRILLVLCIAAFLTQIFYFSSRNLKVYFIDVGQGDSVFISTYSGKNILIDGGGYSSFAYTQKGEEKIRDMGESTVIPYLLDKRVTSLDIVIATHGHEDHIAGLVSVLKNVNVRTLVVPDLENNINDSYAIDADTGEGMAALDNLIRIAAERNINVLKCREGDMLKIDKKTKIHVLHPGINHKYNKSALNNLSLVLKLEYKNIRMLFTGDIEKEAEDDILNSGMDIKANVLKVAHHGSDSSTQEDFLKAVMPDAAVISVGRNNFGHPSGKVLERISGLGVRLFRTDEDGGISIITDGSKMKIYRTVDGLP